MTFVLTPGHRHEAPIFPHLMAQGAVQRAGRGRPKRRPHRIVGDKGYSSGTIRHYCRQHGIRITIPRKRNECHAGPFARALYRTRERVERMINRFKQFRRLEGSGQIRAKIYAKALLVPLQRDRRKIRRVFHNELT